MRWAAHAIDGRGRPSEDRYIYKELPGGRALAAVFDGHSGLFTVIRTVTTLPDKLIAAWTKAGDDETALRAAIRQVFLDHDKSLAAAGPLSYRDSGSTATVALISPTSVIFAFIGDSPAFVLDTASGKASEIGAHVPTRPDERRRILQNGGEVIQEPGDAPRVNGCLMVSRAFGDFSMKFQNARVPEMDKDWAKDFCVTAEPEILIVPRPAHGILAIMSDGLVETPGDGLKPVSAVAADVQRAVGSAANLEVAVKGLIAAHVRESAPDPATYDGDDLTMVLVDVGLPIAPAPVTQRGGIGVLTRKARAKRLVMRHAARTGKKKLPKTFMV